MSVNRLMYWCDECQVYTYDWDDGLCINCSTRRES